MPVEDVIETDRTIDQAKQFRHGGAGGRSPHQDWRQTAWSWRSPKRFCQDSEATLAILRRLRQIGRMLIDLMSVIAKFERGLILERTRAGLEAARARGATFGRRRKMAPQDVSTAKRLLAKGDADENAATVAKRLGVSRRTLFRNLREQRDREQVRQEAAE